MGNGVGFRFLGLLVLVAVVGIAAGYGDQDEPLRPKVVGAPLLETPGHPGGELRGASMEVPFSFNPYVGLGDLTPLLHAALLEVNPLTSELEPALAESFELAPNRITFVLRPGVRWSDGTPFTVDDVVFTFEEVLQNPELLQGLRDLGVEIPLIPFRITVLDSRTLEFESQRSITPLLLLRFAQAPVLPRHRLADSLRTPQTFARAWGLRTPADQIVGLGPFRLREVREAGIPFITRRPVAIVLERNPFYWKVDEAGNRLPYLDRFTLVLVRERAEALTKLRRGEIDLLPVGAREAIELRNQDFEGLLARDGPTIAVTFLAFNQDAADSKLQALFRDVRFRRAVAHTLDRAAMLRRVPERERFYTPRESFVHPLSPFYREGATTRFEFDLEAAEALLRAIGLRDRDGDGVREFPDGTPVAFELLTNEDNPLRVGAGEFLQETLEPIGVRVEFQPIPFDRLVERLSLEEKRPDYQAILLSFRLEGSPLTPDYLRCFFHSQGGCHIYRFSDAQTQELPEVQRRLDEILENPEATFEDLRELQRILSEDLPLLPLWSERVLTAFRSEVRNVPLINAFGLERFVELLWKEDL